MIDGHDERLEISIGNGAFEQHLGRSLNLD